MSGQRPGRSGAFEQVAISRVSKAFDEHYALVDVSAELPAGVTTALLGPNGAGKSTLMSLLSTRARPSEGEIVFGDEAISGITPPHLRAAIGYVGHQTMLYRDLTARENLVFFGRICGVSDLEKAVPEWLERVGLALDMDRPVAGFSRGMAQRLSIARALMHRPRLLLLDEPFTGLDRDGVKAAIELLRGEAEAGAILALCSHDLVATESLATRALILRKGRVVHHGPIGEEGLTALYHRCIDTPPPRRKRGRLRPAAGEA
ncbi:MAG: ABC transporter ATP-binding protein [Bradymonadia bacterium]